jgi:hypothetical protein
MKNRTRRTVALVTLGVFCLEATALAVDSKKAMYVGGTVAELMPEKTEGTLDTTDKTRLVFTPDEKANVDRALEILYVIETRTGKKVQFQDEEAKKHFAK